MRVEPSQIVKHRNKHRPRDDGPAVFAQARKLNLEGIVELPQ
jgi:hypothetical protein